MYLLRLESTVTPRSSPTRKEISFIFIWRTPVEKAVEMTHGLTELCAIPHLMREPLGTMVYLSVIIRPRIKTKRGQQFTPKKTTSS